MTLGVCNCVGGPPPGGRCMACGIVGQPLYAPVPTEAWPPLPQPAPQVGKIVIEQVPSLDDIRKVIREEIERAKD